MMKILILILALAFFEVAPAAPARQAPDTESRKLRLELVYIFEDDQPDFIFVIGNAGFRSVDSLKKFLAGLPRGSTLEWAPGCVRMGKEPLLSSEEEMNSFKLFCEENGIRFVLVPSG
jgi:hypothetical protein